MTTLDQPFDRGRSRSKPQIQGCAGSPDGARLSCHSLPRSPMARTSRSAPTRSTSASTCASAARYIFTPHLYSFVLPNTSLLFTYPPFAALLFAAVAADVHTRRIGPNGLDTVQPGGARRRARRVAAGLVKPDLSRSARLASCPGAEPSRAAPQPGARHDRLRPGEPGRGAPRHVGPAEPAPNRDAGRRPLGSPPGWPRRSSSRRCSSFPICSSPGAPAERSTACSPSWRASS